MPAIRPASDARTPTREAISVLDTPSAASSTIRAGEPTPSAPTAPASALSQTSLAKNFRYAALAAKVR